MHLLPNRAFLLGCALLTTTALVVACAAEHPLASSEDETSVSADTAGSATNDDDAADPSSITAQATTAGATTCTPHEERGCRQTWYDSEKTKHCTMTQQVCGSRGTWLVCGVDFK